LSDRRPVLTLAMGAALLYLVRLGSTDLRQWDEVFYASRALVAGREGQWLDQSAGAIGGLWTGSHPPLVVWLMALCGRVAGFGEWAFRLPVALCGLLLVLVLHRLVLDLTRRPRVALLAGLVLLLTPHFTRYARMSQLDVPVLLWITLALLCWWRGVRGRAWWALPAGLALGLALLSKLAVGMLVPMTVCVFVAWEWLRGSRPLARRALGLLVVASALGVLVAAPWFVAITLRLGRTYWDEALGYHVVSRMKGALEGHPSALGPFYWPMQVVVRLASFTPLLAVGVTRRAAGMLGGAAERRLLWSWLLVPLALFSLAATTYHPYLFLFLLPLVVFVALGLETWLAGGAGRAALAWAMVTAVACVAWAQTRPLQMALEDVAAAVRALRPPAAGAAWLTDGFAALVLVLGMAAWAVARRLPAAAHARLVPRALLVLVFLPALAFAFQPLVSGRADWIGARRSVLDLGCRAVAFEGEDTPASRMNLALLEARGVAVARGAAADSAACRIVEGEMAVPPGAAAPAFASGPLRVFRAAR